MPPEPPDEQPPPPPPPIDPGGGECPRCGTPYEPFQEYCLECGLRLPVTRGLIPVLATAWRRRVPWYPGDWIWPVIAALLVAAIAGAGAILFTTDNSGTKTKAAINSPPPGGTGTNPGIPPPPSGTETGPPPTSTLPTTEPPPPPPPTSGGGLIEWPAGQNGWTIVLASIPQSAGRATATREANKASNAGLTDVGVLSSSNFSSLHAGYYVVYSGVFNSEKEARAGLGAAKSSYPQAYARQIIQ
ncbi:MAG: SPOR domain-containing protein [Actinomycetota bacterium]